MAAVESGTDPRRQRGASHEDTPGQLPDQLPGQLHDQRLDQRLDLVLVALANPHRRDIVHLVGLQPWAVSQLARRRGLSLPAIHKHVAVLVDAGLVARHKRGRTTYLTLNRQPLKSLQDWVGQFHTYWGSDHATYENYAHHLGIELTDDTDDADPPPPAARPISRRRP